MFLVEAAGCVKTLKKESEEPSKVGALGVGAREVPNEAGVGSARAALLDGECRGAQCCLA